MKYIHYCWFGGKPLPKLAQKCLKSWKKYLPDYEIIRWDESNSNLEECPFVKEAYEQKKWAFVADYIRSKAMYEMGGIYFDTDMEIIKPIDNMLKNKSFIGVEDSGYIACGVWYEEKPKSGLSKYLLDFYRSQKEFDGNNTYEFSIPKLITNYLNNYNFVFGENKNQKLTNNTIVYTREYFYPLSYDRHNNVFTQNTCMIHYYDASWVPKSEKRDIKLIRIFGKKGRNIILKWGRMVKKMLKVSCKIVGFPLYIIYKTYRNKKKFATRRREFTDELKKYACDDKIVFCHKDWLGTKYATEELFGKVYKFTELYHGDNIQYYAQELCKMNFKLIIFSAFSIGWKELIEEIRKIDKKVVIKVIWHGSNAMHIEPFDWEMFQNIFELLNNKKINSIAFVKKSMYEYYKKLGYNVEFLMNKVSIDDKFKINQKKTSDKIRIGLYGSGNRWVKNFYNQFAGASLVKNAIIDVVPLDKKIDEFSKITKSNVVGSHKNIPREELLKRISECDIVLNCTFVECAPITPLECLEIGVPCLTGNNHHYWEESELEKYLVVNKIDDSLEIYKRIEYCLKNKEKIISLFKEWKKNNDIESKKLLKRFIKGE